MARKRVVDRTINYTVVTALVVDTVANENFFQEYIVSGNPKDDAKLLKELKAEHETETLKITCIKSKENKKEYRRMTEEFYIQNSEIVEKGEE